ncbi:hypothetical protein [Streptacidiphilus rugosus]|uniref:hypothetical protein n=1 Tax=Streptacidiphilus rugosus TaxID=405783 RepID=UPI0005643572|nr:hypothetical protein [Streptacidiphilus rugosus]
MSETVRTEATASPTTVEGERRRGSVAVGVLTAVGTAVLCAVAYAAVIGTTRTVYGWIGVIIGGAVGSAVARLSRGGAVTSVASGLSALAATFLGQIVGMGVLTAKDNSLPMFDVLLHHTDVAMTVWQDHLGFTNLLGLVLAPVCGAIFPNIEPTRKR